MSELFGQAQQALFEGIVQPLLFALGLSSVLEDAFRATGWLLVGLLQIVVMVVLIGALQRWRPVEPMIDRAAVRTDIVYTLVHRLGLFRVALFFTIEPLWWWLAGYSRLLGFDGWHLDQAWPGVTDRPLVSFVLYLLVFDALDWALHRAQHRFDWWWQLHALHHSQRQMTMWSDNRNHLLDDVLRDSFFAMAALALGVSPSQFVAIVALTQLLESLSHANVRLDFGPLLSRWLVSPRYHREHHAIGAGSRQNLNFAVLCPLWDRLAGTATFAGGTGPTGVLDQLPAHGARDYGRGFWAQQWRGLQRLTGFLTGLLTGLSSRR
ncbi:MAG: sterol desaturase family protein [Rubrivivax sp.]|nr:sterol desaturase family protein [Rubrivivax sp.]